MPKDKNDARKFINHLKAYGLNALLGFGLGVALVFFALAVIGKSGGVGGSGIEVKESESSQKNSVYVIPDQEGDQVSDSEQKNMKEDALEAQEPMDLTLKNRFTVLLIGMDNRPQEQYMSNTDTLIVASIDPKDKKMIFLSVPRDTQVTLANKNKEKINALARLGKGVSSTEQYIEELLGNKIDGYVLTNFDGFKNIVDSLGGINIDVEKNMFYDTGDEHDRYINLKKGPQRLTGTQALQYARFRNDELADISRASRQQEVLKAIFAEATEPRNLPKLPFLIPKVYQAIQTDLNITQLWSLAIALKNREEYEVVNQTLPGRFSIENGISYWKVNPKESKQVLTKLYQGKKSPVFGNSNTIASRKQNSEGLAGEVSQNPPLAESDTSRQDPNLKPNVKVKEGNNRLMKENQGITFEVIGP